jgi:hypothetical protein
MRSTLGDWLYNTVLLVQALHLALASGERRGAGLEQQGFQMLEKPKWTWTGLLEEIDRWASAGFLPAADEE